MRPRRNVLGLDIGGTSIKAGFFPHLGRRVLAWQTIPTAKTKPAFWRNLVDLIAWYRERYDVRAIGVGCPGPLNLARGVVLQTSHLPLHNFPLRAKLTQATKLPVALDNDANAFTLAEATYGAGQGYDNVVALTLGTGVGGGIVFQGRLYHGRSNAGELGYLLKNPRGPRGPGGEQGALQEYAKASALLATARRRGLKLPNVAALAHDRTPAAAATWREFGAALGYALASLTHVLDPDVIVIGGQISKVWSRFAPRLHQALRHNCVFTPPPVVRAGLGDQAGVIGAALLTKNIHAYS